MNRSVAIGVALTLVRGAAVAAEGESRSPWEVIAPWFQPPAEFAGQLGSLKSPLKFDDGSAVGSVGDWQRKRTELLKNWHELMGPWPPVIDRPKVEVLSESKRENFTQRRVRIEIAPGQTGEGWLLLPDGAGQFPAALVVFYEPESGVGLNPQQPTADFGLQLTRRGFVTLSIGSPGGNAWKPDTGTALCQPLSYHAYVAANLWQALAHLPTVDRERIGIVGHSYGGKWAMFAGALWEKFACVVASDPGIVFDESRPNVNYWEPWYLGLDAAHPRPKAGVPSAENPRTGAYARMVEQGRDLNELHALICPRPFLISGGSEDPPSRWIALNHAVAVNDLLGVKNHVALTARNGHTPTTESNAQIVAFFEHFLGTTPTVSLSPEPARLRLVVETDAGGDPDDEQSLVRFLLYSNEWDVEGIIADRPQARDGENLNPVRTGLGIVQAQVDAYRECWPMLVKNDARYPNPDALKRRTVAGYDDVDDGVRSIINAVDAADERPVWYLNWGTDHGSARNCMDRALDRVLSQRGAEGYAKFKKRLRLIREGSSGPHVESVDPPFPIWIDTFYPEVDGRRWYHRFSDITAKAGGFDLERDCRTGHGPLGALYPTNANRPQKEGDTMTFLYLVPTGMNDPEQPAWGGWAGRYSRREAFPHLNAWWANAPDTWNGSTHRDNSLRRWAADLQNDFRSRLDWCVKPTKDANHPPVVALRDSPKSGIIHLHAAAGARVDLDASTSTDPDGQPLRFEWITYPEAGTYAQPVTIKNAGSPRCSLIVPGDAAGCTIHVIVRAVDAGTPPLARYRRVVIDAAGP